MKRIISLILSFILLVCSLAVFNLTAYASDFSFTISNGTATITGFYSPDKTEITVPEKLGNYPVVAIGKGAFSGSKGLIKVIVSNGIKRIDMEAFMYCYDLKSISLPNTLTSMGEDCFLSCEKLTGINIPSGISAIPAGCFGGCSTLKNVSIPKTVKKIGSGAFSGCSKLSTLTIPSGVTSISSGCFSGSGLSSISLPKSLQSIGNSAFWNCSNLTSITIPNKVKTISSECFCRCGKLTSVKLGSNVKQINEYAFSFTKIEKLTIPKSVTSISSKIFAEWGGNNSSSAIKSISVSKDNKNYSSYNGALYNKDKTKLIYYPRTKTELKLAKSVKSIGAYAFNSSKLKTITLPKSVTSIGKYTFSNSKLAKIVILGKMKTIPEGCFEDCAGLTYVKIPNGITTIDDHAFEGTKVSEFDLPNSLKTLGLDSLMTEIGTGFTIPASVKKIDRLQDPEGYAIDYVVGYKGTVAEKCAKREGIKFITAPIKGTLTSVSSPSKGKMKLKWKKVSGAKGFQIQISTSSTMSENTKAYTIKKGSQTSASISKLTKGKKYYVQVRAYKNVKVKGKTRTIYGSWSATKSIKIKK